MPLWLMLVIASFVLGAVGMFICTSGKRTYGPYEGLGLLFSCPAIVLAFVAMVMMIVGGGKS